MPCLSLEDPQTQQGQSHKGVWLWPGLWHHLSHTCSPSKDSGQLPQRSCQNLPLLAQHASFSSDSADVLGTSPHCLSRASPTGTGLCGMGGPVPASFIFLSSHLFLSVPLPQHLPLQTLGPAFSSGSLSKKMLKPWHGRGHISWGSA